MKKLMLGLLALSSVSAFAGNCNVYVREDLSKNLQSKLETIGYHANMNNTEKGSSFLLTAEEFSFGEGRRIDYMAVFDVYEEDGKRSEVIASNYVKDKSLSEMKSKVNDKLIERILKKYGPCTESI